MNNDLISRSALRKALEVTQYNDIDDLTRTERLIDNAPTVTIKEWKKEMPIYIKDAMLEALRPQGEWIPVSERLPDYMDNILITFQKPNREPLVYRAVFIGSKFALDNGDVWNWNDPEIKAWMPLPEAYEEDNDYEEV